MSGLVSCTGAQFCGVAIIETKNRAQSLIQKLEEQLEFDRPVRIHWTGCPNSCGQVSSLGFSGSAMYHFPEILVLSVQHGKQSSWAGPCGMAGTAAAVSSTLCCRRNTCLSLCMPRVAEIGLNGGLSCLTAG